MVDTFRLQPIASIRRLRNFAIASAVISTGHTTRRVRFVAGLDSMVSAIMHYCRKRTTHSVCVCISVLYKHNVCGGGQVGLCVVLSFDAHVLPIGEWAIAIWEERLPRRSMHKMVTTAIQQLDKAKNAWVQGRFSLPRPAGSGGR